MNTVAALPRVRREPAPRTTFTGFVAAEVRAAMGRAHLSQRGLADALGITHASINRRLMGDVGFDAEELMTIALITDTPIASFFQGAPPPTTCRLTVGRSAKLSYGGMRPDEPTHNRPLAVVLAFPSPRRVAA